MITFQANDIKKLINTIYLFKTSPKISKYQLSKFWDESDRNADYYLSALCVLEVCSKHANGYYFLTEFGESIAERSFLEMSALVIKKMKKLSYINILLKNNILEKNDIIKWMEKQEQFTRVYSSSTISRRASTIQMLLKYISEQ